jgi:1-deoxy-D-xylulose-5-phosphate synthase
LKEIASKVEEHVKGFFTPGTLFEEFGFNYIGPIDGHDLDVLVDTLKNIRSLKGRSSCISSPRRATATSWPRTTR